MYNGDTELAIEDAAGPPRKAEQQAPPFPPRPSGRRGRPSSSAHRPHAGPGGLSLGDAIRMLERAKEIASRPMLH